MARFASVAEQFDCAVVVIRHLNKGTREKAIYRGLGSIDITAACRSVLMVGSDRDNDARRIVAHAKCNLAPLGPSLSFTIIDGRFEWTGEVDVSAEDLCHEASDGDARSARDEAMEYLRETLASDPVPANDILKQAKSLCISERTLKRAKRQLGTSRTS